MNRKWVLTIVKNLITLSILFVVFPSSAEIWLLRPQSFVPSERGQEFTNIRTILDGLLKTQTNMFGRRKKSNGEVFMAVRSKGPVFIVESSDAAGPTFRSFLAAYFDEAKVSIEKWSDVASELATILALDDKEGGYHFEEFKDLNLDQEIAGLETASIVSRVVHLETLKARFAKLSSEDIHRFPRDRISLLVKRTENLMHDLFGIHGYLFDSQYHSLMDQMYPTKVKGVDTYVPEARQKVIEALFRSSGGHDIIVLRNTLRYISDFLGKIASVESNFACLKWIHDSHFVSFPSFSESPEVASRLLSLWSEVFLEYVSDHETAHELIKKDSLQALLNTGEWEKVVMKVAIHNFTSEYSTEVFVHEPIKKKWGLESPDLRSFGIVIPFFMGSKNPDVAKHAYEMMVETLDIGLAHTDPNAPHLMMDVITHQLGLMSTSFTFEEYLNRDSLLASSAALLAHLLQETTNDKFHYFVFDSAVHFLRNLELDYVPGTHEAQIEIAHLRELVLDHSLIATAIAAQSLGVSCETLLMSPRNLKEDPDPGTPEGPDGQ